MKKKLLLMCLMIVALVSLLAISAFAESAYVNANGEQVEAGSSDIAYEIEIENPWNTGGGCRVKYIYLYDKSITKIVIPEIEFTHSNGTVYKMAEYDYVRLSTGWSGTLSVYALDDKDTKANSLHTQIKELEFHIPVLADGAGSQGNLAGWTGLEKLSFYKEAYEPQNKGGFLTNCTSLKELHFYGANNELSGNFFSSTMVAGGKVVFHENATGTIRSTAMQGLNGKDITVYMNTLMQPKDTSDPRLTWNKNGNGLLKFVLLVKDKSSYTPEQIKSYETIWLAGNNKDANNAKYSMPINTFCEYYGEHIEENALSSCVAECLSCKLIVTSKNAVHNTNTTIVYDDFSQDGTKTTRCLNENCPLNVTPSVEKALAIFECIGYSVPENERIAVTVGYTINKNALGEYEAVNSSFEYGVFAVLESKIGTSEIFKEDGTLTTNSVCANLTNNSSTAVTVKILGFTTDEHKALGLAMGIYVKETVEEQSKYTYVQASSPEEGQKYSTISYNGVL